MRNRCFRKYHNNGNKGFTLVEMIVAIAILSVLGGAVVGFLSVSTKSYKSVSTEVDLQEEAQLAMNQIRNMVINSGNGLAYQYTGTKLDADGNPVTDEDGNQEVSSGNILADSEIDASVAVSGQELYVYNSDSRYIISYNVADSRLTYTKQARQESDPVNAPGVYEFNTSASEAVLADNISAFHVSMVKTSDYTTVNVALTLSKDGKSCDMDQTYTLRNSLLLNASEDAMYDDADYAGVTSTYKKLVLDVNGEIFTQTINVDEAADETEATDDRKYSFLLANSNVVIPYNVMIYGDGYPSQEYIATVTDNNNQAVSGVTVDMSGRQIIFDAAEFTPSNNVTLTITSKMESSLKISVTFTIRKLNSIAVRWGSSVDADQQGLLCRNGATINLNDPVNGLYAEVAGENLEAADKEIKWVAVDNCALSADGSKLTVAGNSGDLLVVQAVSAVDDTIYGEMTLPIVTPTITMTVSANSSLATLQSGDSIRKGSEIQLGRKSDETNDGISRLLLDFSNVSYLDDEDLAGYTWMVSDSALASINGDTLTINADSGTFDVYVVNENLKDKVGASYQSNSFSITISQPSYSIVIKEGSSVSGLETGTAAYNRKYAPFATWTLGTDDTCDLYVDITNHNLSQEEIEELYSSLTWRANDNCSVEDATLTIAGSAAKGSAFTVKASIGDKEASYTSKAITENQLIIVLKGQTVELDNGTLNADRCESYELQAYDPVTGRYYKESEIEWNLTDGPDGIYNTTYESSSTGGVCKLWVSYKKNGNSKVLEQDVKKLDYNNEFTATVSAWVKGTDCSATIEVKVPKVIVCYSLTKGSSNYDLQTATLTYKVLKYRSQTIYYKITGISNAVIKDDKKLVTTNGYSYESLGADSFVITRTLYSNNSGSCSFQLNDYTLATNILTVKIGS